MPQRIVIILLLMVYPLILGADGDWNLITDDDGIALYTRSLRDNSTSEFKGICVVDRPIETVGSVLSDVASYPDWFFRCIQSHKIPTEDSSDLDFLLYVAIDTPWPFTHRDAVYKVVTTIDHAAGKVVVRCATSKAQRVPRRKNFVRITDSRLQWILERLSAGQTRITFINRTHAAGSWGDYISNSGTRATTLHSLKNLQKLLIKKQIIRKGAPA